MEEKEVELIDYLKILWKRKWIIIIGTLLCMVFAGVVSFILKPVYEIDAIVQPGKFFTENETGNFEQVVVEDPQQIADKVRHKSYDEVIVAQMGLDATEFPELEAENIKDTLLTRIWIRDTDTTLAKRVLNTLLALIQGEIDEKIEIEIANIDALIKANEIEKERRIKEIGILKKKLKIINQRKVDIAEEMDTVKSRIEELEKEQLRVLRKETRSEMESMGLLLYSTEIQKSLQSYDMLNEKLSDERIKEENVNSDLEVENATINKIENQIAILKERKGRIDKTKVVKEPTASLNPVSPKKKLNVLIAAVLGFIVFVIFAFFYEYIQKQGLTG
jgi:capsular polysaccharide biosynthesis protein